MTGGERGRFEAVKVVADLARAGVDVVLGAVSVESDGVGAAAHARELSGEG